MRRKDSHQGEIRGQDIPQAVPEEDVSLGKPLGFGQKDIFHPDLLQKPSPDKKDGIPKVSRGNGAQRQDKMPEPVQRPLPRPAAGKEPEGHGKEQDQRQGEPEFRHTADRGPQTAEQAVRPTVLEANAENPQGQGQEENQQQTSAAQQEGIDQPAGNHVQHVGLILEGNPELPFQRAAEPSKVLGMDRFMESQPFLRPGAFIG